MTRVPLHFRKADDLIDFINIVSRYKYDVELKSGDCILDAKSIGGVVVLGVSDDLEMLVNASNCQDLVRDVAAYA